jgi:hypothetical protein
MDAHLEHGWLGLPREWVPELDVPEEAEGEVYPRHVGLVCPQRGVGTALDKGADVLDDDLGLGEAWSGGLGFARNICDVAKGEEVRRSVGNLERGEDADEAGGRDARGGEGGDELGSRDGADAGDLLVCSDRAEGANRSGAHHKIAWHGLAGRKADVQRLHVVRPAAIRHCGTPFAEDQFDAKLLTPLDDDIVERRVEAIHELGPRVDENDALLRVELAQVEGGLDTLRRASDSTAYGPYKTGSPMRHHPRRR